MGHLKDWDIIEKMIVGDYSPDQPRDENGRWTDGGSSQIDKETASAYWFEYEYASAMSDYIKTGDMPNVDVNGQEIGDELQESLKRTAEYIQESGSKTKTRYKTLYRGMVLTQSDADELFKHGEVYRFDTLTATATDKNIARIYANPENANWEGYPVLIEISKPDGIYGFDRDGTEVVMPKGAQFRVSRKYTDADGTIHVSLYAKKGDNVER